MQWCHTKCKQKVNRKQKLLELLTPVPCASLDHFTYHPLAILYRQKCYATYTLHQQELLIHEKNTCHEAPGSQVLC